MLNPKSFIGTWKLVSFQSTLADGTIVNPLGEKASGFILYSEDGYMNVAIMKEGFEKTSSPQVSYLDYFAYAGRYEVKENTIIHHMDVAVIPQWVGHQQERVVEWLGDQLCLSTTDPITLDGITYESNQLIWERVEK